MSARDLRGHGTPQGASPERERLDQLLADRATEGLADAEWAELERLLGAGPADGTVGETREDILEDAAEWDRAAAWVDLAFVEAREARAGALPPLPEHLRGRIVAEGRLAVRSAHAAKRAAREALPRGSQLREAPQRRSAHRLSPGPGGGSESDRGVSPGLGVAVALAAGILLAMILFLDRPGAATPERAYQRLVARASDLERAAFAAVPGNGLDGISGEVVWSDERQQGFLRLAGVPANDAAREQYQLWIVDPDRGHAQPVDGGVFDVAARPGPQTIPIDAKLPVDDPTLFVITLERKGGVVVSEGPFRAVAELAR